MSHRRDYYHDPAAPKANRIVAGGSALVTDERGRILLQRRRDSGNWALPGGVMEVGETLGDAVVRETLEETGIHIELTGLLGIYTDPQHVIAYSDGEVRQEFAITYLAKAIDGELRVSEESTDVRFVRPDELDALPIHESVRLRLRHFIDGVPMPYLG